MSQQTSSYTDEQLVKTMQVLGDPTRFQMFKLLDTHSGLCVGEIANRMGVTNSAISQHFRTMEILGMVSKVRNGQRICYQLRTDQQIVMDIIKLIRN